MEIWEHFLELMSDPAHLLFEVATTLIIAGLGQILIYVGLIRPDIRREHRKIDTEHGHQHQD